MRVNSIGISRVARIFQSWCGSDRHMGSRSASVESCLGPCSQSGRIGRSAAYSSYIDRANEDGKLKLVEDGPPSMSRAFPGKESPVSTSDWRWLLPISLNDQLPLSRIQLPTKLQQERGEAGPPWTVVGCFLRRIWPAESPFGSAREKCLYFASVPPHCFQPLRFAHAIAVEWGSLPWSRAVLLRGSGWVRPLPIRSAEEAWELFEERL